MRRRVGVDGVPFDHAQGREEREGWFGVGVRAVPRGAVRASSGACLGLFGSHGADSAHLKVSHG